MEQADASAQKNKQAIDVPQVGGESFAGNALDAFGQAHPKQGAGAAGHCDSRDVPQQDVAPAWLKAAPQMPREGDKTWKDSDQQAEFTQKAQYAQSDTGQRQAASSACMASNKLRKSRGITIDSAMA